MKLKEGDTVLVKDFSYSRFVVNGELVPSCVVGLSRMEDEFVIVDMDIKTNPVTYQIVCKSCNNVIIQSVENSIVGFIEERFLVPGKHQISVDGKTIEISHESFLNLKKQLK